MKGEWIKKKKKKERVWVGLCFVPVIILMFFCVLVRGVGEATKHQYVSPHGIGLIGIFVNE